MTVHDDLGRFDDMRSNHCSDGCHIFLVSNWDGRPRCRCGKVMDEHLTEFERAEHELNVTAMRAIRVREDPA